MMRTNNRRVEMPPVSRTFLEHAAAEPEDCVSVGGLARELGLLGVPRLPVSCIVGRFVELARRSRGWNAEMLAGEAQVALDEIVGMEADPDFVPDERTLVALSRVFGLPGESLQRLVSLTTQPSDPLRAAAVQFAARSEGVQTLTDVEKKAFDEFVQQMAAVAR